MRSLGIFLLSICLMVSVSTSLSAHNGKLYHAVGIPDDRIPVIDGDLSDWGWVPERYIIRTEQMEDALGGEMPGPDDLDCRIIVGWNGKTNLLYIAVSVKDDIHNADSSEPLEQYKDDGIEIYIDANHNGSQRDDWWGIESQDFGFSVPREEGEFVQWCKCYNPVNYWPVEKPYCHHAYRMDGPNVDYEVALALWDRLYGDDEGPQASIRHQLASEQIIGMDILVNDVDEDPEIRDCQLTTGVEIIGPYKTIPKQFAEYSRLAARISPNINLAWGIAGCLSDFIVDKPAETTVEEISWGLLKQMFKMPTK